jgi:hypothetical protein
MPSLAESSAVRFSGILHIHCQNSGAASASLIPV